MLLGLPLGLVLDALMARARRNSRAVEKLPASGSRALISVGSRVSALYGLKNCLACIMRPRTCLRAQQRGAWRALLGSRTQGMPGRLKHDRPSNPPATRDVF